VLDDSNVLRQRDPSGALQVAAKQYEQVKFPVDVKNPEHDQRQITKVVVTGMGGSALAALIAKAWLKTVLKIPIEIVRTYDLPSYVDTSTLVIASSYSGNTEETVSGLAQAIERNTDVAIITSGGRLKQTADERGIAYVELPAGMQPRMAVLYNLRALVKLLVHFNVLENTFFDEIAGSSEWLEEQTNEWVPNVSTDKNYAKQLALLAVGKTPVIYGGSMTAPLAYKWKISWNENAKNVAFWNEYPEFNHNEFMGWTSHPIEKPFVVFDLMSSFEHSQILKRFEISDRLLSGKRPKAQKVELKGNTLLKQMLYASVLGDFISIYVAILNGVDPTPVDVIEKLKKELA
jgi:glucose/mannose-6-phosphate isomerase